VCAVYPYFVNCCETLQQEKPVKELDTAICLSPQMQEGKKEEEGKKKIFNEASQEVTAEVGFLIKYKTRKYDLLCFNGIWGQQVSLQNCWKIISWPAVGITLL
jgi:hypothetical protein